MIRRKFVQLHTSHFSLLPIPNTISRHISDLIKQFPDPCPLSQPSYHHAASLGAAPGIARTTRNESWSRRGIWLPSFIKHSWLPRIYQVKQRVGLWWWQGCPRPSECMIQITDIEYRLSSTIGPGPKSRHATIHLYALRTSESHHG